MKTYKRKQRIAIGKKGNAISEIYYRGETKTLVVFIYLFGDFTGIAPHQ